MSAEHSSSREVGFAEALDATLPILLRMKKTLRGQPKATKASLERLSAIADPSQAVKTAAPKAPPMSPTKTAFTPPTGQTDDGRLAKLDELRKTILSCTRCPNLVRSRTQVVYGIGNPFAELLFVGEAPGEEEDLRGEPFIGKAGQLLTKIIGAMEYTREEIFIANVLKCRPDMPAGESGNRKPKPAEMATCLPWLTQQIELIRPKVIVALGLTAVEGLLGEPRTMRDVRGKWLDYHGTPLMPTYHPAYLLRNQTLAEKRKVWEDMLLVLGKLGRPISEKQQSYFLEKT
jgi:DNA polymerase